MNGWWCCSCMCNNHEAWRPDIMLVADKSNWSQTHFELDNIRNESLSNYHRTPVFGIVYYYFWSWFCVLLWILWNIYIKLVRFVRVGGEPETECVFLIALFSLVVAHNNFTWCHKKRTVGYPEELCKVFFLVTSCCTNIFSRAHMPFIVISFSEEDISIFFCIKIQ